MLVSRRISIDQLLRLNRYFELMLVALLFFLLLTAVNDVSRLHGKSHRVSDSVKKLELKSVMEILQEEHKQDLIQIKELEAKKMVDQQQPEAIDKKQAFATTTTTTTTTKAVVHMGPHKTGTTTIQDQCKKYKKALKRDGYEMPWLHNDENNLRKGAEKAEYGPNQSNFATCFIKKLKSYPCQHDLLLHGLQIAKEKKNLLVSAELFSAIDEEGLNMLSAYLSHWDDVEIVVYYRRFFSWVGSYFNSRTKHREFGEWTKFWGETVATFFEFDRDAGPVRVKNYSLELVRRLKKTFRDNVIVVNMHDESVKGPDESFFCNVVKNASHTCNAIRNEKGKSHLNPSVPLEYGDIIYAAMKAGLVEIKTSKRMHDITRAAKRHQEEVLGLTAKDFPRACPSSEILEKIWQISMEAEMEFFPEQVNGTDEGLPDLRSDFENAATSTLCHADIDAIIQESEWISFFESLEE